MRKSKAKTRMVRLPCASANLRRTTRLVAQMYEEALRPSGVTGGQFTLLQALKLAPGVSQKQLAEILGADSTTLTRTLALLVKHGWLRAVPAADRRALRLSLTKAGEGAYERALPCWQSAQRRFKHALGATKWNQLIETLTETAELVQ